MYSRAPDCRVRCAHVSSLLPDEAAYATAYAALPTWRRRKCDAFRFAADRRRSVAAWLLLERMLAEMGLEAASLAVTENDFQKPAFDPSVGLHFSLSHAGERVMAAIDSQPVGCDVERLVPFDDAVARSCLTDGERAWVGCQAKGVPRDRAFIRLWVRKEALVKAIGRGFDIEPKGVSVLPGDFPSDWRFDDIDMDDGYLGCVVFLARA